MTARGFTIVEVVVAVAIMTAITGAMVSLMHPSHGMFQTQPEVADMQQRLRVGVDALAHDLMMAGAGTAFGDAAGPLARYVPGLAPFRRGARAPDPPGSFASDRLSALYVPATSAQARVGAPMSDPAADIPVVGGSACPAERAPCGFEAGALAIVFDDTGAYDTFRITGLTAPVNVNGLAAIQHAGQPLSTTYGERASVAQVVMVTYWLLRNPEEARFELMRYDGDTTDAPVVDHVVGFSVDYFGDPRPPVVRLPVTAPGGPWTSYGPRPPPPGADDPADLWGPGENCLFARQGGVPVPRPGLAPFGAAADPLVDLDPARLTDGPWCPDAASPARYDADLLRIRRVRVTLRLQAAAAALRGIGPRFARPGTSSDGTRVVPDVQVSFDVTPRNMGLGR